MVEWILDVMSRLGYPGIAFFMLLENLFPPIPSELIMPLAGYTAGQGRLSMPGVVAAGTVGSVLGAIPWYYLGRWAGEARLKAWVDQYGSPLGLKSADVDKAQGWFARYGGRAVFFGRVVPGVRTYISLPAGLASMRIPPFLVFTVVGSAAWSALLAYAGLVLGENYEQVAAYIGPVGRVVFWGGVLLLVGWVVYRKHKKEA